jgi:predicted RNA binding protein YcfA (HicA-like mRNA interferase family)
MPRLPVIRAKEVVRALQKAGFVEVRSRGSHMQLKRGNLLVTIPTHRGDLNRETLKSILRQAKLTAEELEQLM